MISLYCKILKMTSLNAIKTNHWLTQSAGGCKIHRLVLCRGIRPSPIECPGYDVKQSDSEIPAMLELWGMRNTSSLPSLSCPLWPGVVASNRVLSMGQIELNCVLLLNWRVLNRTVFHIETAKLNLLNWIFLK